MSKSKKKEIKESKERKDLSIPRIPDTLFVIELDSHVLVTGYCVTECVFPHYKFDCQSQSSAAAFYAAEEISIKQNKLVADTVELGFVYDPHIYSPVKFAEQSKRFSEVILAERTKLREAWAKLDKEEKDSP